MILGIGTDVVDIARIKNAIEKNEKFLTRVYTENELQYAISKGSSNYNTLAGMWAAKEAFAKATGLGFRGFFLKDVEILHNESGAPYISLSQGLNNYFDKKIHISISHSNMVAVAYCVIEG